VGQKFCISNDIKELQNALRFQSSKLRKYTIFLPIIPAYSKGHDSNAAIGGARTQTFENDF
jgi:hypothetical protein